jgi:hypothetical protein
MATSPSTTPTTDTSAKTTQASGATQDNIQSGELPLNERERVPSDWVLEAGEDDMADVIVATNMVTNRVFKGLLADFNALLQGTK